MECKTDSKKHCSACMHYDYCDRANRCNGDCHLCDDDNCENNPKYKITGKTKMNKKQIEFSTLYSLCNREQLFTCGSNKQYEKMFMLAEKGITKTELAYILYICSVHSLEEINNFITPFFNNQEDN